MSAAQRVAAPAPAQTPAPSPRRRLRVVRRSARPHRLAWTLATVAVLAGAVFGAVTLTAMAADEAVAARDLEQRLVEARAANAVLLVEVAGLEDPDRLSRVAEELGLVPAGSVRHLRVARLLPVDGIGRERLLDAGETTDPLKSLLSDAP